MDSPFPVTNAQNLRSRTQEFFERYLFWEVGDREHVSVLIHDLALPEWFLNGLRDVTGTRWIFVEADGETGARTLLEGLWSPNERYISVHDYVSHRFVPFEDTAIPFMHEGSGGDYTSFEFPRHDLTDGQVNFLLEAFVSENPEKQLRRADAFFDALDDDPAYRIEVRSGRARDRVLTISGPEPWMEVCGPLCETNVRFAPGAELFYGGQNVNGVLHCSGALNLLPLRGRVIETELCRKLMRLGARMQDDPIDIHVETGRVTRFHSEGPLASEFTRILAHDEAFRHVVEIGIGLATAGTPLILDWAASSNEAAPGVHLGVGADPGDTTRFRTTVHLDFVCPDVSVSVRGAPYLDTGHFVCEA